MVNGLMYILLNPQLELDSQTLCPALSNNHNFHMTGKWYNDKCSERGYGFVCQKPQGKIHLSLLISAFLSLS